MAEKKNPRKEYKDLVDELKVFGIGADWLALIDAAVRNDWTANEFTIRLTRTEAFRKKFPGLIVGGDVNEALIGQAGRGVSTSTLGQAIQAYNTMLESYNDSAKKYGFGQVTKDRFAALLKYEVSPDEFGNRLKAIDTVRNNPEAWDAYKRQVKLAGGQVTNKELYKAIASNKFADTYEATMIQTAGIGLNAKEAAKVAKRVGATGDVTQDFARTLDYVRQNLAQVGPELQSQGINAAKLVKVLGAGGQGYGKEMDIIRQTVATREGLARPVAGIYASKGTGGGLSLYEDQGDASYG